MYVYMCVVVRVRDACVLLCYDVRGYNYYVCCVPNALT